MKHQHVIAGFVLATASGFCMATGGIGVGGGVIAGGATGFAGSVTGQATSEITGSALSSTQIIGNGKSVQQAYNYSEGQAFVGGHVTPTGAFLNTSSSEYSYSKAVGFVSPGQTTQTSEGIYNGAGAFGTVENTVKGKSNFATGTIAGIAAIGAIGGIAAIPLP